MASGTLTEAFGVQSEMQLAVCNPLYYRRNSYAPVSMDNTHSRILASDYQLLTSGACLAVSVVGIWPLCSSFTSISSMPAASSVAITPAVKSRLRSLVLPLASKIQADYHAAGRRRGLARELNFTSVCCAFLSAVFPVIIIIKFPRHRTATRKLKWSL